MTTVGYAVRFDEAIGPAHARAVSHRGAVPAPAARRAHPPRRRRRGASTNSTSGTSRPIWPWPGCGTCGTPPARPRRAGRCRDARRRAGARLPRAATLVRSEGRTFEVAIEHLPTPDDRPLDRQVAGAVRRLLREEPDGDLLVFLPGAGESAAPRRPSRAAGSRRPRCPAAARRHAARGADPRGSPGDRRKMSGDDVARSSVTIDGVVGVIDSGLARIATHSPWTGRRRWRSGRSARRRPRSGPGARTHPRRARATPLYPPRLRAAARPDHPEIARADSPSWR